MAPPSKKNVFIQTTDPAQLMDGKTYRFTSGKYEFGEAKIGSITSTTIAMGMPFIIITSNGSLITAADDTTNSRTGTYNIKKLVTYSNKTPVTANPVNTGGKKSRKNRRKRTRKNRTNLRKTRRIRR